jgi:Flp pilus assembly pilin Flp
MNVLIDVIRRGHSWVQSRSRCVGDEGANLVEYALLVALIAIVCLAAVTFVGSATCDNIDNSVLSVMDSSAGNNCP